MRSGRSGHPRQIGDSMSSYDEGSQPPTPDTRDPDLSVGAGTSRRRLLQVGGVGLLGATALGLAGCMGDDDEEGAGAATTTTGTNTASGSSILDRWTRDKKAKLGVDL